MYCVLCFAAAKCWCVSAPGIDEAWVKQDELSANSCYLLGNGGLFQLLPLMEPGSGRMN